MYRFEARYVGRSRGKSSTKQAAHNTGKRHNAVASAAYLSRSAITDHRTGQTWDYSRHFGGANSELMLPTGSQAWMAERSKLWNAIEKVENRKDSMLTHDFIITLHWKLDRQQQWDAVKRWADEQIVSKGKPVDMGMHIYGERWNASAKKTAQKVSDWKEWGFPFYELKNAPTEEPGPHVAIERFKNGNIKGYYLFQPHIHVMTTFRTVDPTSPTGFSLQKETVGERHWKIESLEQLKVYKEAWARIGGDALEAAGHLLEAERFRVGHLKKEEQRKLALARGDNEWARHLSGRPEPKKGPVAAKMEREDRGHESKAIRHWQQVREFNDLVKQIDELDEQIILLQERKPRMDRQFTAEGQKRAIDDGLKQQAIQIEALREQKIEIDQIIAQADHDRRIAEEEKLNGLARRAEDSEIKTPRDRHLEALGDHRGSQNTFDMLLSAARIEADAIKKEHDQHTREAHEAKDPDKKIEILLVRDIKFWEHMAAVEERLSNYSSASQGNLYRREYDEHDKPIELQSERHARLSKEYTDQALLLREELRDRRELAEDRALSSLTDRLDNPQPQRGTERGDRYRPLNEQHDRIEDLLTRQAELDERRQQAESWRPVRQDEVLQPGAHVRMDIETGQSMVRETTDRNQVNRGDRETTDARTEVFDRKVQAYREADREAAIEMEQGDAGRE